MLSEVRKRMRVAALQSAAEMIRNHARGADDELHGLSEDEFDAYVAECVEVAKQIDNMAMRFAKKHNLLRRTS